MRIHRIIKFIKDYMMTCNVGTGDRIFRFTLAGVVFALGIYFKSWWGLFGFQPLLTATFKWCPVYLPFKYSSVKKQPTPSE
ncbi:DUF2892 domain-containing protein [Calditrichota bacterium]